MATISIDSVQMVRDIRDSIYNDHKQKGVRISATTLSQEARQTALWKRLNKK